HAKLMPLMEDYLAGIQAAMIREKISCPVSVVSGNGRPITMDDAVQQAGATVASGPACTAEFGAMQTKDDGLVVDVGGTTTDIAMIKSGRVLLAEDGCRIGQWQTHVEAVDMYTGGIGGDSLVRLADKGGMEIGPSRVVPLAVAQSLPPVDQWLGTGEQAKCISLPPEAEVGNDPVICAIEKNGPATPEMLNQLTGQSGMMLDKELENLARNQLIVESGFTPTDALIVLGRVELGERQPAEEGAAVLAEVAGLKVTEFCEEVVRRTEEKIENLIIDYLIYRSWGKSMAAFISGRNSHPELSVNFGLKIPIIGIGAAARSLLPAVADRLGTTVSFPQHCEVGNAMGAAFISTVEKLQPSGAVD
ncbi:MAG: hydantoinase/oxoprolinase family protein, partial [Thermodesulfobacteriota bacterium]